MHDDHAGIRGRALGTRMMYVAPHMASDSNMRIIIIRQYIYITISIIVEVISRFISIQIAKIFRRKDITLMRNRVIQICIQNTPVPPIAGYF